jgi:hypothetical protein
MLRRDRDRESPTARAVARTLELALLAAVGLSGCGTSRSQQAAKGLPSGHVVRGQQVLLRADGEIPGEDEVLSELQRVRERLHTELDVPQGEREVIVYLFADRGRYAEYMYEHHPNLPARRAFFIGTPKELAVYAHWGEHVLTDLRHEYTHGLLHASIGHVPLWLDEGIAEYLEIGDATPGHLNSEHLGRLTEAAAHGWKPDLARLERLEQVEDMHRADYQEAWAWVHYLLHEVPQGREMLSQYLAELRRNQSPPPLSQQLGGDLQRVELQLAQYVARIGASGGVTGASLHSVLPRRF